MLAGQFLGSENEGTVKETSCGHGLRAGYYSGVNRVKPTLILQCAREGNEIDSMRRGICGCC